MSSTQYGELDAVNGQEGDCFPTKRPGKAFQDISTELSAGGISAVVSRYFQKDRMSWRFREKGPAGMQVVCMEGAGRWG